MTESIKHLRIFIASPEGLADERKAFREELHEYSEAEVRNRGIWFEASGWEDTLESLGRPQELINEDVRNSDYLVLVLWDRWGTPPDTGADSPYSSGVEEEFEIARRCAEDPSYPMKDVVVMFKQVDPRQRSDPGEQLQKVLEFQRQLQQKKEVFYRQFDTTDAFRKLIRRRLAHWAGNASGSEPPIRPGQPTSHPASIESPTPVVSASGSETRASEIADRDYLSAKAWDLVDQGRLTEAETEFSKSISEATVPGPFISFAEFLWRNGRPSQAQTLLEKALVIATQQGDQASLADVYAALGNLRSSQGDNGSAKRFYQDSLSINERLERPEGIAWAYTNLGDLYLGKGDINNAEDMYRRSLDINQTLGRNDRVADGYGSLGNVFRLQGLVDAAKEMFQRSLELNKSGNRIGSIAIDYTNLGLIAQAQGDYIEAEALFRQSLEINERLGRWEGIADACINLGIVMQLRKDYQSAEAMLNRALDISKKMGGWCGDAHAYGNLGKLFLARNALNDAEKMFRSALIVDENCQYEEGIGRSYMDLGDVRIAKQDRAAATKMYEKALEISLHLHNPSLAQEVRRKLHLLKGTQ